MNSNPLADFEELIQYGGLKENYKSFLLAAKHHSGTFNDIKDEFEYFEQNEYGEYKRRIDKFEVQLNQNLDRLFRIAAKKIDEGLITASSTDRRADAILLLDKIEFLLNILANNNTYNKKKIIEYWLYRLIQYINDKYHSLRLMHPTIELVSKNERGVNLNGFFGFNYSVKKLDEIISTLTELDFLDDDIEVQKNFKEVIIDSSPEISRTKIFINCTLQKASYIFFKLEKYFTNLKPKTIEDSKCFYTKQSKSIKASNIAVSKIHFLNTEDNKISIENIDVKFKQLDKKLILA